MNVVQMSQIMLSKKVQAPAGRDLSRKIELMFTGRMTPTASRSGQGVS